MQAGRDSSEHERTVVQRHSETRQQQQRQQLHERRSFTANTCYTLLPPAPPQLFTTFFVARLKNVFAWKTFPCPQTSSYTSQE